MTGQIQLWLTLLSCVAVQLVVTIFVRPLTMTELSVLCGVVALYVLGYAYFAWRWHQLRRRARHLKFEVDLMRAAVSFLRQMKRGSK